MKDIKKWITYAIRAAIIIVVILAVYSGFLVLRKYIREESREYNNMGEVIENYYDSPNLKILNVYNYYYLIDVKASGNVEELIRFEDNKYMAFDKVLRNTKGIGADSSTNFNRDIYFTDVVVYEYLDEYVIVLKRERNQDFVVIYDDYEIWSSEIIGDTVYYFNVRRKDDFTYNYKILAETDGKVYEIADRTSIVVHLPD